MIDIKAIKAAAEAATKGEWSWQEGTPLVTKLWNGAEHSIAAVDWRTLAWHEDGNCAGRESGANAKHIATANPATVSAMCDEIERLRADAARLVAAIKSDRHDWEDWPTASREAFKAMEAK